jgi:hypothetical protein
MAEVRILILVIALNVNGPNSPVKRYKVCWVPMAHVCNPSNSGVKDQEDHGSKPAWANSSARLYLETPFIKIGLVEWLKVKALSLSPSTTHTHTHTHTHTQKTQNN